MMITLKKAVLEDCLLLHTLQVKAFKPLLDKYQDFATNPGAEKPERIFQRFHDPITDYYLILLDGNPIGASRICNFEDHCILKQIFILPEYQNRGYAQQAIRQIEALYPVAQNWRLDTILQEEKLCYLYEKMGYCKTGQIKQPQPGMDLVFYERLR